MWPGDRLRAALPDEAVDPRPLLVIGDVEPPVTRQAPKPRYPVGNLFACVDGPTILQFVVGEEGIPRSPRILSSPSPMLSLAALDAVEDWRFTPARRGGQPVAVWFNLEVNFEIPICTNPVAHARRMRGY